jgi:hypothetical protein
MMLRKVTLQVVVCALAFLCLLVPVVSRAQQEAPGKAPAPAAGVATVLSSIFAPAGGADKACPAGKPVVVLPLQKVRKVTSCTRFACDSTTNCTKLCGDVAVCMRQPTGSSFCDEL